MYDDYVLKTEDIYVIIQEINENYGDIISEAERVKYDRVTDTLYFLKDSVWYSIQNVYTSAGESDPVEVTELPDFLKD